MGEMAKLVRGKCRWGLDSVLMPTNDEHSFCIISSLVTLFQCGIDAVKSS